MGLNPPVPQQDSNWEIRVAVLLSLLLQVVLIFLGPMRKRSASPIPRFIVWSCYLLADWVADLGLGLILNNMGNIGGGGEGSSNSPIIFAFWTPFLLLHLGGPDTITAYSLEDNELWLRHLIGLLFELFSATVVIFCSVQSNPLVSATMLMLVAGVIKYGERTYSLYSGSVGRLRDRMMAPPDPGLDYAKLMGELDARKKAGEANLAITIAEREQLEMIQDLQSSVVAVKSLEVRAYEFFLIFQRVFVDVLISFKQRMKSRTFFVEQPDLKAKEALEVMQLELGFMYDALYTKAPIAHTCKGWVYRSVCSCCLVSALVIFFFLDKKSILRVDVGITYALLLGAQALDAAALIMLLFSNRAMVFLQQQSTTKRLAWLAPLSQAVTRWSQRRRHRHSSWSWSAAASQMNLIRYCLEKPGPYKLAGGDGGAWKNRRWLMHMVAKILRMEEMVDYLVFVRQVKLISDKKEDPYGILEFIFDGLKHMGHNVGNNKESIKRVCNRRRAGVLRDLKEQTKTALRNDQDKLKVIVDSVENKDLDEALLLWHIATDLCFLSRGDDDRSAAAGPQVEEDKDSSPMLRMQAISKILSEYMLYLLIKQPDMLSATAGIGLRPYRDTCAEAQRFFASGSTSISRDDTHKDARQALLRVNTSEKPMAVKGDRSKSVLFDGVILAKVLRELDEGIMWRLVSGVWWEMLTSTAANGRGNTHVRSLNHGGELITIVWLLMQHMGLNDKYEIQQEDPLAQLPPPPSSLPTRGRFPAAEEVAPGTWEDYYYPEATHPHDPHGEFPVTSDNPTVVAARRGRDQHYYPPVAAAASPGGEFPMLPGSPTVVAARRSRDRGYYPVAAAASPGRELLVPSARPTVVAAHRSREGSHNPLAAAHHGRGGYYPVADMERGGGQFPATARRRREDFYYSEAATVASSDVAGAPRGKEAHPTDRGW